MTALLHALVQASWQGAVFTVLVGAVCALRLTASVRAFLWFLVGVKFVGVFLWLLWFGERGMVGVDILPPITMPISSAFAVLIVATWVVGIGTCAVAVLMRVYATHRRVQSANGAVPSDVQNILAGLVSPPIPTVRIVAPKESPQVTLFGTKPVVLLPADLLPPSPDALAAPDLRLLLAHEIAHIRRGDLWTGWVFTLAQVLFFFHPFVVWARHEWETAREEACDLLALRASGGAKDTAVTARYGALLLRVGGASRDPLRERNMPNAVFLAASPFAALRRRLRHLERSQTTQKSLHWLASMPIVLLFGGLLLPLRPVSIPPVTRARLVSAPTTPVQVARASVSMPKPHSVLHPVASVSSRPPLSASRSVVAISASRRTRRTKPIAPRKRPSVFVREPDAVSAPVFATNAPSVLELSNATPLESVAVPTPAVPETPETLTSDGQNVATDATPYETPLALRAEPPVTPETPSVQTSMPAVSTSRARSSGMTQPSYPPDLPEVQPNIPVAGKQGATSPRRD